MVRRHRVAMVSSRYAPVVGGIETHVREVASRMVARETEVTVLTADPTGRLAPAERQDGVQIRRFRAYPRFNDLYTSPALMRELKTGAYDIVHIQGIHTLLPPMALRAAQRRGTATVVSFHTGGHSSRVRNALRTAQWRALAPRLRRADALVAVCEYEVRLFGELLGVERPRIHLVPNGADPLPVGDEPVAFSGSPLITSVGRLERYKGHHRLIRAMPALLTMAPRARLVIAGHGGYERHLRRLAAGTGVEQAVTFATFDSTQRAELGALLRASNVVVLMSDYEAHPVAIMEALALGCKVVVASTPGLEELTSYDLVTAIDPEADPSELACVLASVASTPPAAAPELASWDDCADDLLALYDEVRPLEPPFAGSR